MDESQQDGLFERTQVFRHVVYIVGNMANGMQVADLHSAYAERSASIASPRDARLAGR